MGKLSDIVAGILTAAQKWERADYQRPEGICSWSKIESSEIEGEPVIGVELYDGTEFFLRIEPA